MPRAHNKSTNKEMTIEWANKAEKAIQLINYNLYILRKLNKSIYKHY